MNSEQQSKVQGTSIPISQIDDTLQIYREHKVVLYGVGNGSSTILDLIQYFKIPVYRFCGNDSRNFGNLAQGIPVISPQELKKELKKENILVQIAETPSAQSGDNQVQRKELEELGAARIISWNEGVEVLRFLQKYPHVQAFPEIISVYEQSFETHLLGRKFKFMDFLLKYTGRQQSVFLCHPSNVGIKSLRKTLEVHEISSMSLHRVPEAFQRPLVETLPQTFKILTAVREPISRDLSELYGAFSTLGVSTLTELFQVPFSGGGDAQEIFDLRFDNPKQTGIASTIGEFMSRFQENIMDLSKHPFDKEKGYSIMTEGNIQVFVYQLERMNDIAKEVSDFIGEKEFSSWVMGNEAKDKWISKSYKEAKKKLRISQAYFDQVYECPWLKHFYSEEDIERFKSQWQGHIDPTK